MLTALYLFFLIFLILVALATLFIMLLRVSSLSFSGAPYIQIPDEVLPHIVKALDMEKGSVVYDLGCGDGKVLFACYNEMPDAKYIGIDIALFPIFVARRKLHYLAEEGGTSDLPIKLLKEDFFNTNLSNATHLFIYLYPKLVNSLLPKLEKELKSGTRVVTCDYRFDNKEPTKIIDMGRGPGNLGKFLYVYTF